MTQGLLRERRGGALMLVVGYLAVMTLAAAGFLSMLHHHMAAVRKHEHAQVSRNIAEGGAAYALAALETSGDAYLGSPNMALGEGRFRVAVTRAGEVYQLEVQGEYLRGGAVAHRTTVYVDAVRDGSGRIAALVWNPEEGL
jgi:hypothetical protein